jgi:hypothetical protein
MYTATIAVAPPSVELCIKNRIFFRDKVRRKENECGRGWEKDSGAGAGAGAGAGERDDYTLSQIVIINDHLVINGVTRTIMNVGANAGGDGADIWDSSIREMERVLLEQYAQTFLNIETRATDVDAAPAFVFQTPQSTGFTEPRQASGPFNVALLHVSGVWEAKNKFGLEYKWTFVMV